ncbi:HAD family hydrolase [Nonomuraea sp. NPDC050643]|uniref:HAD family hydrolase n=1 Tax=Nonomuraea sp. NPDC050643 TaxID=3155660 RepID=UPI0033F641E5
MWRRADRRGQVERRTRSPPGRSARSAAQTLRDLVQSGLRDREARRPASGLRVTALAACYSGVPDALAELRAAGWRVGIVTNGAAGRQLAKIRRTGLDGMVDGYAISQAEGVRKPAVELFAIAARRCGTDLGEGGWMVGDNLATDIVGARAAGLRGVWVDHGTWPGHDDALADHVVAHVVEGVAVIRNAHP